MSKYIIFDQNHVIMINILRCASYFIKAKFESRSVTINTRKVTKLMKC